jgi:aryl-alcohol dehydrogenase (NADP+)
LYYRESDFAVAERVGELAQRQGVSPAQIGLAWLLHQPGITAPIVGASKMPHLEDAVAALKVHLSDEERAFLQEPYQPHPVLGHK